LDRGGYGFVVFYVAALFRNLNDFMSDYHWADIAEAPRDGTWIVATEMWRGMPISIKVRFAFDGFRDADDTLWEPQYFVKEGKKP